MYFTNSNSILSKWTIRPQLWPSWRRLTLASLLPKRRCLLLCLLTPISLSHLLRRPNDCLLTLIALSHRLPSLIALSLWLSSHSLHTDNALIALMLLRSYFISFRCFDLCRMSLSYTPRVSSRLLATRSPPPSLASGSLSKITLLCSVAVLSEMIELQWLTQ